MSILTQDSFIWSCRPRMKIFVKNRDDQKVCVVVEGSAASADVEHKKVAFVMHGLSGNKEEYHIRAIAEAFLEDACYTVVTFDATNTFGESDGTYEDATVTNYFADLEDVVAWSSEQSWYNEPFIVAGHSLGGMSAALFAEKYPYKVKALAPISTVVSGTLSVERMASAEQLEKWQQDKIRVTISGDGKREKRLKWTFIEDMLTYDLLPDAHKLTMPVLMVVGDNDSSTPLSQQQLLFEKLPFPKELHIIKGAQHSFYQLNEQKELKSLVKTWIANI